MIFDLEKEKTVPAKKFYESKTIAFGALIILIAVANYFGFADFVPSPQNAELIELLKGLIIGAITLFLRFKTNKPIE